MPIKHNYLSGRGDNGDAGAVQPSHWNSDHVLDGILAALDAVAPAPNTVFYFNGSAQFQLLPFNSFAPINSPALTGVPTAPTAPSATNSIQIATTAFVKTAISDLVASSPTTLDTLNEIAAALGNDPNFSATITAALGNRLRVDAAQGLSGGQQAQGRSNLALGTAATLNVGTGANNVVQLDGTSKLPAVDGSQLTNINFSGAVQYNIVQSLTAPQTLQARQNISAAASPASRTRTVFTSGSGNYSPPTNCKAITVRMVGGGAGGGGTGSSPGAATAGGNTTFSTLTANGGAIAVGTAGVGGTATGGDINIRGGSGGGMTTLASTAGAQGGSSAFGGEGAGGAQAQAGTAAATNSGSGGGSGSQSASGGSANGGGGAGGYCEKLIVNPTGPYAYSVGAAGAAGTAGGTGFAGGAGAAGIIIIDELY